MLIDRDNKRLKYILHNDKNRVTLFAFEDSFHPSYLIKIYDMAKKLRLDQIRSLLEKINMHNSEVLKNSTPRWLSYDEFDRYCLIREEYIKGIGMEMYAERNNLFWEKDFFVNLALAADWISHFHKNYQGKRIVIPADKISLLYNKIGVFLKPTFLNISGGDIEMPTVISHCDFRPSNILRYKDRVMVIDWDKFQPDSSPLFDLLEFILRYVHAHYKFQKEKIYLEPEIFLRYFNLVYLKKSALSERIKEKINFYSETVGLHEKERDVLLLLWLYNMLYPAGGR